MGRKTEAKETIPSDFVTSRTRTKNSKSLWGFETRPTLWVTSSDRPSFWIPVHHWLARNLGILWRVCILFGKYCTKENIWSTDTKMTVIRNCSFKFPISTEGRESRITSRTTYKFSILSHLPFILVKTNFPTNQDTFVLVLKNTRFSLYIIKKMVQKHFKIRRDRCIHEWTVITYNRADLLGIMNWVIYTSPLGNLIYEVQLLCGTCYHTAKRLVHLMSTY